MKKMIYGLVTFMLWTHAFPILASESKAAESQTSKNNSDSKISSARVFANALLLADIYRKMQKIAGTEDRDQLNPLLNQLNGALDEVLAFKNSFTPQKRQKIELQLSQLKKQIQGMAESQSKELKTNSLQLTSTLLDLVDTLLDKSQGSKM
jgi:hypothetical protein